MRNKEKIILFPNPNQGIFIVRMIKQAIDGSRFAGYRAYNLIRNWINIFKQYLVEFKVFVWSSDRPFWISRLRAPGTERNNNQSRIVIGITKILISRDLCLFHIIFNILLDNIPLIPFITMFVNPKDCWIRLLRFLASLLLFLFPWWQLGIWWFCHSFLLNSWIFASILPSDQLQYKY